MIHFLKVAYLVSFVLFVVGCSKSAIDVSALSVQPQDIESVNTPQQCMYLYSPKKWEVAVVEFSNNTGYGNMTVGGKSTTGVGRTRGESVTGRVSVQNRNTYASSSSTQWNSNTRYSSNSTEFMGQFAPSLGSFAQSVVEEAISQMGGITLYNRSDMEKILNEQQFQMTIANPDTMMEFGKLSGVRFIMTGSVDNIEASYIAPTNFRDTTNNVNTILSLSFLTIDAVSAGWYVKMQFTIKLLDAETGKVLFSKTMSDKARASQSEQFQPDIIINAAKGLMSKSVGSISNELLPVFALTSYINEMRGGKQIASIGAGLDSGVKKDDIFEVYDVITSQDFLTKETKCSLIKTSASIKIDSVSSASAWGYINGGKDAVSKIKVGSIVQRSHLGNKK